MAFIHGAGCTPAAFGSSFVARFAGARAFALPGRLGDSRRLDSVASFADAVTSSVAEAFGDEDVVLCGHSMGGAVAMEIALRTSALGSPGGVGSVRGVVAIGSGSRLRVAPVIFERLAADFPSASRELATMFFASPSVERVDAAVADMAEVRQEQTIRDFRACDAFDAGARLQELSVPLLAVTGDRDAMTPPKYALSLADRVPSGTARIIDGAGHFAMIERPDDVASAIAAFAAALPPRS
ncbi:MAG TPA: alpha/beta hydrolase [Candidatus Tumulicola sp.]